MFQDEIDGHEAELKLNALQHVHDLDHQNVQHDMIVRDHGLATELVAGADLHLIAEIAALHHRCAPPSPTVTIARLSRYPTVQRPA